MTWNKRYTKEQDKYLRRYYHKKLTVKIANYLGRTIKSVVARAKRLGLANKGVQYEFLLEEKGPLFADEIAKEYNRTAASIMNTIRYWVLLEGSRIQYARVCNDWICFIDSPNERLRAWNRVCKKHKKRFQYNTNWSIAKAILGPRVCHHTSEGRKIIKEI